MLYPTGASSSVSGNSFRTLRKTKARLVTNPDLTSGSVTRQTVCDALRPSVRAASSSLGLARFSALRSGPMASATKCSVYAAISSPKVW